MLCAGHGGSGTMNIFLFLVLNYSYYLLFIPNKQSPVNSAIIVPILQIRKLRLL